MKPGITPRFVSYGIFVGESKHRFETMAEDTVE